MSIRTRVVQVSKSSQILFSRSCPGRGEALRVAGRRQRVVVELILGCAVALCSAPVWAQAGSEVDVAAGLPEGVGSDWLSTLQAEIRDHEYRFRVGPASYRTERGDIWQAPNRALDLRLYVDKEGLEVFDRSAEGAPTLLRLRLDGWGRHGRLESAKASTLSEREGRLRRQRGGLAEQYENGAAGVQLGWEIATRPKGDGPLVIALRIQEASARPRSGGCELRSQSGGSLVLQAARATDASGRQLQAEMMIRPDGLLEIVVDDQAAAYPLNIKTLLTGSADAVISGGQEEAHLGYSVASGGDVNGDGFSDVVVGAPAYDNGESNEGIALVFLGSSSGLVGSGPADAHAFVEADLESARLGSSVASAGDVNGDGFSDIVVGARGYSHGENDEGAALVFLGSASGITGSSPLDADAVIEADQDNARLGESVASAGDVNGDGFADIIVGAPWYSNAEHQEGAALVFHGSATGITGSNPADADGFIEANQVDAYLGERVGSAGDVNSDGFADVIVGAWGYSNGEFQEGAALVFLGSASGITGTSPLNADALIESDQADARMIAVASAGDVNGDGFSDIIIGAHWYANGEDFEGVALVFHGSATGITGSGPADADALIEGNQEEAGLGSGVASAGDINGDGYADVIVGAYVFGSTSQGAAWVFLGSAAGITASSPADAHLTIESDQGLSFLGFSVASAGDVNGDGFSDVIVGAWRYSNTVNLEGAAFIYYGSSPGITGSNPADAHALIEGDANDRFGVSVASAGDVNGDGYADVVVGAPFFGTDAAGAAWVFLGSAEGITATSAADAHFFLESDQDVAKLGWSVASAGDVNGDGFSDIIIGAYIYDHPEQNEGIALIFHGSAAGLTGSGIGDADAFIEGDQIWANLGYSVASAGDVNGDGYSDVVVSARGFSNGEDYEGIALVFHGSALGITGSSPADADAVIEANQDYAYLGLQVASAGDVNGDGFADIAVGAGQFDNGEHDEGIAMVFLGSPAGIVGSGPGDAHALIESNQEDALLGLVTSAGDINGDGFGDIIVGGFKYANGESNEGIALVYLGSDAGITGSSPSDADGMIEADQVSAYLGLGIASAGDVNGDGFADIVVGAYLYDSGEDDEGAAFVFLGSAAGITGSSPANADAVIEGDQAGAFLGGGVASAGDVDGDGFADIIIGAHRYDNGEPWQGVALVFAGNDDLGRTVRAHQLDGGPGPLPVQAWGLSKVEDGFVVRMTGTSPRGRERVRLEVEACPAGAPFGDAPCSRWLTPDWEDTGATPDGVTLEIMTTGLPPGLYHWRARTLHAPFTVDQAAVVPPPNPSAGPWRRLQGQAVEADIRIPLFTDLTAAVDDGVETVVPGETVVTYAIDVANLGPREVSGALVRDPVPAVLVGAAWTCAASGGGVCTATGAGSINDTVDLPVGAALTYTLTATVDPAASGELENTVTVLLPAGFGDLDPLNNLASDLDTLTPEVDLTITKDNDVDSVVAGQELIYLIQIDNPGPSTVTFASVSDVFPAELIDVGWTCNGSGGGSCTSAGTGDIEDSAHLPPGTSVLYNATATVDPGASGPTLDNTATVTVPAGVTERNPGDNTATDSDILLPQLIFTDGFESGDTSGWSSAWQ